MESVSFPTTLSQSKKERAPIIQNLSAKKLDSDLKMISAKQDDDTNDPTIPLKQESIQSRHGRRGLVIESSKRSTLRGKSIKEWESIQSNNALMSDEMRQPLCFCLKT